MPPAVHIEDVHYSYGRNLALNGCTFSIPAGKITGVLGPNGSGKTTLFSLLSRQRRMQEGVVRAEGPAGMDDLRIGWAASEALLYRKVPFDRFVENVYGPAVRMTPADAAARGRLLSQRLGFDEFYTRKPNSYSQGTGMKASLLLAFLERPDLVVLDEPFNGLDVHTVEAFLNLLREEADACTIVIADHQVGTLDGLVDHVAFINRGQIAASGQAENFAVKHGTLKEAYLRAFDG